MVNLLQILNVRSAPHRHHKALLLMPVIGTMVAVLGPFGSYTGMDLTARLGHFILCAVVIGTAILQGSYLLARRFFKGNWPLWAALIYDVGLALPAAGFVYLSLGYFAPGSLSYVRFADVVWQNLLICLTVRMTFIGMEFYNRTQLLLAQPQAGETKPDDNPFGKRLPFALRHAPVTALSSEDHYLRVYTLKGEALIHMTLSEAVELMGNGFQIHRSHWINARFIKDYDAAKVHLTTGLNLPLSRHRKKAFESFTATLAPPA